MLKISVYGPLPDMLALAELVKHVPPEAKEVVVQAPLRRAVDLRPCQRPGVLEMSASIDNCKFLHLSQLTTTAPYEVKTT